MNEIFLHVFLVDSIWLFEWILYVSSCNTHVSLEDGVMALGCMVETCLRWDQSSNNLSSLVDKCSGTPLPLARGFIYLHTGCVFPLVLLTKSVLLALLQMASFTTVRTWESLLVGENEPLSSKDCVLTEFRAEQYNSCPNADMIALHKVPFLQ